MKIERTGPAGAPASAGGVRRAGARQGASFSDTLKQVESTAVASAATSVTPVSAVMAVQEVEDDANGQAQAMQRGEEMLDRLDELRLGLIEGRLAPDRIEALLKLVQDRRETVQDVRLKEILDDIDLRAQVELAKLGRLP